MDETNRADTGTAETRMADLAEDRSRVTLPRWAVRVTLGLCPLFALMIAALSGWIILFNGRTEGLGGVLYAVFWLGVTGFCLWSTGLIMVYLRHEPALSPRARSRLGGAAAIILLSVAVLAMTTLLVVR